MAAENHSIGVIYTGLYSIDGRTLRADLAPDTGDIEIVDNVSGQVRLRMTLLAAENLAFDIARRAELGRELAKRKM